MARAAVEMIRAQQPDILFLDVQMPELDGLGVIDAIGATEMPLTVFVTAYDEHAIRAFEANALDYLLKPFSDERFEATMARLRRDWMNAECGNSGCACWRWFRANRARTVAGSVGGEGGGDDAVYSRGGYGVDRGGGGLCDVACGAKEVLYRAALNDLAKKLDPMRFVRVHRSAIVNIESVLRLEPISHGEFEVVMKSGTRAKISRTYRAGLEKRLGQSL